MGMNRVNAAFFPQAPARPRAAPTPLYTPEQRERRDNSKWTLVQGILAPIQFLACLVSIALITHYLVTDTGLFAAHLSVWIKTALLVTIMVTGALWEKVVFGQYLFAKGFFWEDVVSLWVIAVHLLYVWAATQSTWPAAQVLSIALLAYGLYIINAAQFIYKLRLARAGNKTGSKPA
jgi:3-vinyl bacteriochlorophyllide hydratase